MNISCHSFHNRTVLTIARLRVKVSVRGTCQIVSIEFKRQGNVDHILQCRPWHVPCFSSDYNLLHKTLVRSTTIFTDLCGV